VLAQELGKLHQLALAADETVQRHRQLTPAGVQGPQRREVRGKVRVLELEQPLGFDQVAQPVLTQVPQRPARRQLISDQAGQGRRDQNLTAVTGPADARTPVHRLTKQHPVAVQDLAGVHTDAHLQRLDGWPPLDVHRLLQGK
jgi:hypothetical protein